MGDREIPLHYVCTRDEARTMVDGLERFWLSNCGCREERGKCERSRMDVCLYTVPNFPPTGSDHREVTRAEVDELLALAEKSRLVTRPFRGYEDRSRTEGICFCCDDCCSYFRDPTEVCDKGSSIERTGMETCDGCGLCVDVCHFGARRMSDGRLVVDRDRCYGCGLCVDACPLDCVKMGARD